jgi:hypothetical protein
MLGIKPATFYRWYDRKTDRVWNRIPDAIRQDVVTMALEQSELSPREAAEAMLELERARRLRVALIKRGPPLDRSRPPRSSPREGTRSRG